MKPKSLIEKKWLIVVLCLSFLAHVSCRRLAVGVFAEGLINPDDLLEDRVAGKKCNNLDSSNVLSENRISFNSDIMHCVNIKIDSNQFETMRYESRFGPDTKNQSARVISMLLETLGQCDVPWPNEFVWYKAQLSINGKSFSNVGIRKKGFLGSVFSPAPSIKLHLNRHTNQTLGNTENIVLNNNAEDQSRIRSAISYHIFNKAGYIAAPECNLANVSVNNYALGTYSNLEAIDKAFLESRFGNSSGHLYEGQLTDFVIDWLPRWEAETPETDILKEPIYQMAEALSVADKDLVNELEKQLDINKFIQFWALETLLEHSDGYCTNRNNFYVYFNPTDNNKAQFIPWGMNYFQGYSANDSTGSTQNLSAYTKAIIPARLSRIPSISRQYLNQLQWLLNNVWNEQEIITLIDAYQVQVANAQQGSRHINEIEEFKNWVKDRRRALQELIKQGLPQGTLETSCF